MSLGLFHWQRGQSHLPLLPRMRIGLGDTLIGVYIKKYIILRGQNRDISTSISPVKVMLIIALNERDVPRRQGGQSPAHHTNSCSGQWDERGAFAFLCDEGDRAVGERGKGWRGDRGYGEWRLLA